MGEADGLELAQETYVVRVHVTQVVDTELEQRQAIDAETEGEARPLLGVDASGPEDVWVNHATWVGAPVSTTHSVVGGVRRTRPPVR